MRGSGFALLLWTHLRWAGRPKPIREWLSGFCPAPVALACPWVRGATSTLILLPASATISRQVVDIDLMVGHPFSSESGTAHNPWSGSPRACYLWVCRTPRHSGVCIPRDTGRSAWPPRGCCSTGHSLHCHSHRPAGCPCLNTEGDSPQGASAGQGKPALVATPPWARGSVLHEGGAQCQLQRLGLALPNSAD